VAGSIGGALSTLAAVATITSFSALTPSASAATTGAPSTNAAPTAAPSTSTSTTTPPSPAARWVRNAISAEEKIGSVRIEGKVTQGKNVTVLDLLVNGDGEGGGVFVQRGDVIKVERVGTLLYFNAPKRYWARHASGSESETYGGKWIKLSAADTQFLSFDEFLDAADLVTAAFEGSTGALTVSKPTFFAHHKVVIVKDTLTAAGKRTTGSMFIGTASPHNVYKVVDDSAAETTTLVFDHYGRAVALTVPAEAISPS
jgi:hypothetical protein